MYKDKVINHKFYQSYDLFDSKIIEELSNSCDTHFELNLNSSSSPLFKMTNCIMDCHGLHLTDSKVYPYCQEHWNIFCKSVCKKVREYITLVYPELLKPKWIGKDILSTGYQVFPHSCWAIKILPDKRRRPICFLEENQDPLFPEDTFITALYYLQNSSQGNGTIVQFDNSHYYKSDGVENSLFMFRQSKFGEYIPFFDNESKTVIRFDFCILGTNHNVPWTSPRVVGP